MFNVGGGKFSSSVFCLCFRLLNLGSVNKTLLICMYALLYVFRSQQKWRKIKSYSDYFYLGFSLNKA